MNYDVNNLPDVYVTISGIRTCAMGHDHGLLFMSLGYRVCDPQAIQLRVADADGLGADWFFDRDTLNDVIRDRVVTWTGQGNVNVRVREGNREQLKIRFRNPEDHDAYMDVVFYRPFVAKFLRRTYDKLDAKTAGDELAAQVSAGLAELFR